ncbi:MAG: twin-arginine translocase subunit TatC [Victivallales bacterium]
MSDTKELSFLEHLDVLRGVLFKIIGVFSVLCVPAWFCAPYVMKRLLAYAAPAGFKLHYFSLMEPFFIQLKVMLTLAVFASLPFTAYYLWGFIAPGLTELERKRIRPPLFLSFFLAVAGAVFAILLIVPVIVRFSLSFQTEGMEPVIGIESFVSMMLLSALACAVLSQFPVLLLILLSPRDRRSRLGPQTACRRARRDPDYCGGRDAAGCGQPAYGGGADLSPV